LVHGYQAPEIKVYPEAPLVKAYYSWEGKMQVKCALLLKKMTVCTK
jgi:hypothetical protein